MDNLLIPLAKILFAQKYHADSKEWVDKEWLESSDSERWLLTKRAETLLPFLDEAQLAKVQRDSDHNDYVIESNSDFERLTDAIMKLVKGEK
jgi:hypothetical protein